LKSLNTSVSPCEDFYDYACGNFKSNNLLDALEFNDQNINDQLIAALNEDFSNDDHRDVQKMKNFYQSCTNSNEHIFDYVRQKIQQVNWADTEKFNKYAEDDLSLTKFITDFQFFQYHDAHFFTFNHSNETFVISQPKFSEEKINFFTKGQNDPNVKQYIDDQINFAVLLNMKSEDANIRYSKVLKFETQLSSLINSSSSSQSEHEITSKKLKLKMSAIDWGMYFNNHSIDENFMKLKLKDNHILFRINRLILTTPKTTLMDFIVWRFIGSALDDFKHIGSGSYPLKVEKSVLESKCLEKVKIFFKNQASYLYLKKYWNKTTEKELINLAEIIRHLKIELTQADKSLSKDIKLEIINKLMTQGWGLRKKCAEEQK
jgi:hypothetical protein